MRKFKFPLDNGTTLTINPPSARLYYKKYAVAKTDNALFEAIAEICNNNDEKITITVDYLLENFSVFDLQRFTAEFPKWINSEKDSDPN
ncbi:MAG: hypothetical protein NC205_00835 [Prevotella sp.]|nr:hypothetical protein [Alistipes senegalensis]MCM1357108.1 hypothetical protein [Prevotella sp.]MCM1472570.1 hypothetical protein [Muribaculaceae bacterium]